MPDCHIRVIHNIVTALLEYLNLLAWTCVDLILFVAILLSISIFAMQNMVLR